jgi:Inner membrane protein import complex subunit Tim54
MFLARGVRNFWFGTPKRPLLNRHPAPWPAPRHPAFRPTPPPKPTTLVGKVKSYIPGRNWQIFGGIVLGWVGFSAYDKWKAELIVEEGRQAVRHLAARPIGEYENVPGLMMFICAPPGDQLKWNKDVWRKFVKVPEVPLPRLFWGRRLTEVGSRLLLRLGMIIHWRCIQSRVLPAQL